MFFEDPENSLLPLAQALQPGFEWQTPVDWPFSSALARTRQRIVTEACPETLDDLWALHDRALRVPVAEKSPPRGVSLLEVKQALAQRMLIDCQLCAHHCGVNRSRDERGPCGVGAHTYFAPVRLHEAEEPEIAPSLCVPLTGCSWHCVYCHTPELINGVDRGTRLERRVYEQLYAQAMQPRARSVSFVGGNPDQHLPAILDFLAAAPDNFSLPLVWNSNMYGSPELYRLLHGIVDTYVGDLRYGNDACARQLSGIETCWEPVTRNWRLVREQGAGLIARLLVLPGHVDCCAIPILDFVANELPGARLSLLEQFQPAYLTGHRAPAMARRPSEEELRRVRAAAVIRGLLESGA